MVDQGKGQRAVCPHCGGEVLFDALITFTSTVVDSFETNVCNKCWKPNVDYRLEWIK